MVFRVNKDDSPWEQVTELIDSEKLGFVEVDNSTGEIKTPFLSLVQNKEYALEACIAKYLKLVAEMQRDLKIDILYSNIVIRVQDCYPEPVTINAVDEALDTLHDAGVIQLVRKKRVLYLSSINLVDRFIEQKGEN